MIAFRRTTRMMRVMRTLKMFFVEVSKVVVGGNVMELGLARVYVYIYITK